MAFILGESLSSPKGPNAIVDHFYMKIIVNYHFPMNTIEFVVVKI